MAETVVLEASKREGHGSKKAARLRKEGKVPGVIYGHKEATEAITLPAEELLHAIQHKARVVDLKSAQVWSVAREIHACRGVVRVPANGPQRGDLNAHVVVRHLKEHAVDD